MNSSINYLIVSQYFWPENFKINDFALELTKRGHRVDVLTGEPNYPHGVIYKEYVNAPEKYCSYYGARIYRVPVFPRGKTYLTLLLNYISFVFSASLFGPFKLKGKSYDIILVFQPSPITVAIPAIIIKKLKCAALILWVQDLWPQTLVALGIIKSKLLIKFLHKLISYVFNFSDLILVQSLSFIEPLRRVTGSDKLIEYFPNWAEEIMNNKSNSFALEVPRREDVFTILFAGNLGEAQDLPAIVDAMSKLKENSMVRWVILGDGRKSQWLRDEIIKRKLGNSVLQLGQFPLERMTSFFSHAGALLISLQDKEIFSMTIPGKFQTYLTAGVPIIGMINGECAEYIKQHRLGITCSAGNSTGLVDAILSMSSCSFSERESMAKNCLALVKSEFNGPILMERFEKMALEAIIKSKK